MKTFRALIAVIQIVLFIGGPALAADNSGTFRGKWWNFYDRAMEYAEQGDYENAINDLKTAIGRRDKDQRMARTYGMHFIDYFPHRELGVVYFQKGDITRAAAELEESVRAEETAKAVYFLNKVRALKLRTSTGGKVSAPVIAIESPADRRVQRLATAVVKGRTSAEALVSKVTVNNSPVRFDMAKQAMSFEKEVELSDGENEVTVRSEDLFGNAVEKKITVVVDREGPTINIYDVVAETKEGRKTIRVTGEVNDGSGIGKLLINGKAVAMKNQQAYEFNVSVDTAASTGKFVVQAFDSVENETMAEFDLAKEVAFFSIKLPPVLLAFNAPGVFSSDKEPPVIKLKDSGEVPAVYVDKYYIEGEVLDEGKVDRITVNGTDIGAKKGKKIFFSRIVSLKEGKNPIAIAAFDSAGNKSTKELVIARHIPGVQQLGSRMSVTVLPFDAKQKASGAMELAYDLLIGSFVDQKRFNIIERAKLEKVLQEQKIAKSKLSDPEHSLKVGKLMSAEAIISTTIKEDAKSIEIVSRVINTETSEVMEVKDVYSEDKGMSAVKDLMEGLAVKVASGFPLVEGIVIKGDRSELYSDIGDNAKIRKNTGVIVYRRGKEIKHPITGKSLGWDTVKLGEGRFEDIQQDFSKIRMLDKGPQSTIAVKDLIITK